MTKQSLITLAALSLLLSGCATHDRKQQTPPFIEQAPQVCSLTPCRLPGRPPLALTESAYVALDETEEALTKCAAQVLDCIQKQGAVTNAAKGQASVPRTDVPGQDAE